LAPATAAMLKSMDWPPEQDVPAATGWTTDHAPLAHCWKEVPPMQLNMPSLVQGPLKAPALEEVLEVPEAGVVAAADSTGAAAEEDAAMVVTGDALGAVWDSTVAKTPPGRSADVVAAGVVAAGAAADVTCGADVEAAEEAAWLALADPDPDPPPAVGETDGATTWPQEEPVGVDRAEEVCRPSCSTESPGSGKSKSVESTVAQPLPMLAVNMSGRALYAA
jgi:hypothetical protein